MTDTRRGAKFAASCLECPQGFDDFVLGLGITGRIGALQQRRNEWMTDHARATGHVLFEYSNTDYRRVELLVEGAVCGLPVPERGLNP